MNNNTFIHKYLSSLINKDDICVDMTAGNGFDTLFLADKAKHVYAFDISVQAIHNTKEKVKDFNNVTLIHDDHSNIDNYINEDIKLFIFNLGYLPNGDKTIITQKDNTLIAFKKAYDLLINNGYIVITFYIGHKGGKDEYYLLDDYIKENKFQIIETYRQDKINSPITYIIKKINQKH